MCIVIHKKRQESQMFFTIHKQISFNVCLLNCRKHDFIYIK
uniref:Uncharacterized protein n=1 Tax=Anguilla anguilla TaxID=7936 RepID=A0A0E9PHD8_ANGAN